METTETPLYERLVNEGAWYEAATRLVGTPPPFVPYNGESTHLSEVDACILNEFFLWKGALFWQTGVGSMEAVDLMVAEAQINGNFNRAYQLVAEYLRNRKHSQAQLNFLKISVPAWGVMISVRGTP